MKKLTQLAPLMVLALVMFGCGPGGGTAEPQDIGDAVLSKIQAKDFDSLIDLMDQSDTDISGMEEIRTWRIEEGYERWKDYKKGLEGDDGSDPKSKSGIDGEDAWKSMSMGKDYALDVGLYRLYVIDDLDKRLEEVTWARRGVNETLDVEGQGTATVSYQNVYKDRITVSVVRKNGLWYLAGVEVKFNKELPEKPKDD